jgi:hypothetical protein
MIKHIQHPTIGDLKVTGPAGEFSTYYFRFAEM